MTNTVYLNYHEFELTIYVDVFILKRMLHLKIKKFSKLMMLSKLFDFPFFSWQLFYLFMLVED